MSELVSDGAAKNHRQPQSELVAGEPRPIVVVHAGQTGKDNETERLLLPVVNDHSSAPQGTRFWGCASGRSHAPDGPAAALSHMSSPTGRASCTQPENDDSPLLMMPLTGAAVPRRLVDCVRKAAFAPAGRTIVYVPCASGANPPLHALDPVSGKDRVLGTLEHFPQGEGHVNLAVTPDLKTILFKGKRRAGGDLMLIENFR